MRNLMILLALIFAISGCGDTRSPAAKQPAAPDLAGGDSNAKDAEQRKIDAWRAEVVPLAERIAKADSVVIYSLLPVDRYPWDEVKIDPGDERERLSGYVVHAKAELESKLEAADLADALTASLEFSDWAATCYIPRHAIVADGTEYFVCFMCGNVKIVYGDRRRTSANLNKDRKATFDRIWKENKLEILP